tara:strand:- start:712 stop:1092 length:381 start_codon:yes stop_codon:yes gene_type:complete
MNIKKRTMDEFNLDLNKLKSLIRKSKIDKDLSGKKVYDIVNESYGINYGEIIHVCNYITELSGASLKLRKLESKLYPFFDITISLLLINKNYDMRSKGIELPENVDEKLFKCIKDSLEIIKKNDYL